MKTRIGLIGSGYMASEYLKASVAVENIQIVSIYSRNNDTATLLASKFKISKIAKSVEDFENLGLDFLIVCVPELATTDIISSFSKLKLPLLVEKPVGLTFADAIAIEKTATTLGLPIFVALNRRFYNSSLRVFKEMSLSAGRRFVRVNDQENTIAAIAAGQPEQVVNNWMFANSIHIIDFISIVCRGEPLITYKHIVPLDKDAYIIHASIQFSSGDEALYTCYWNSPAGWSVDINTATTAWQLSPLEIARTRSLDERKYNDFGSDEFDLTFKPGLVRMLVELEKCSNGKSHNLPTISDANRTMRLIDLIYSND